MDFHSLIKAFAKNNNLAPLEEEKGRYTFILDSNTVECFSLNKHIWFESDLGSIPEKDSDANTINHLLLTRSMGFIRDQRACLSIDQKEQRYCLHQRIPLAHQTVPSLQLAIENFGGCLQYLTELMKQAKSEKTSSNNNADIQV